MFNAHRIFCYLEIGSVFVRCVMVSYLIDIEVFTQTGNIAFDVASLVCILNDNAEFNNVWIF